MPNFLTTLFGSKAPGVADARAGLARVEADLAAVPTRVAAAEATLKRVADLSDAEHKAALEELEAAKRSSARLEAQVAELREAVSQAEKAEAAADLRARHDATRKRAAGIEKALNLYDTRAAAVAQAAADIAEIENEVDAVNREIDAAVRAGLDAPARIETPAERFRIEPDHVTPDRTVAEQEWKEWNHDGRLVASTVFEEFKGETRPINPTAELRPVERIIPGHKRPGRRLSSIAFSLVLPASRLGRAPHWPRTR